MCITHKSHKEPNDEAYWSPEFRKICGWSPDEIVSFDDSIGQIPLEERGYIGAAIQRAHDPFGDGIYSIEHRIIRRDGAIRWIKVKAQTFFEGEGADRVPIQTIGVVLDITEKKKREIELIAAKDAAEAANIDGKEGIEKASKNNYDILLMDLQMPVMDGYEATAALRKKGYSGKIIALTAHALAEERERCLKSGFDDHLSKPVNREILIQRVEYWAGQKKAPLAAEQHL